MEACGVTPSIPISSTITQPFRKTCPAWWMIKTRVKSPALQRLMAVPPAVAHGRSDGFITVATGSRREECVPWSFKIPCGGVFFRRVHAQSAVVASFPSDHPSERTSMMARCCRHTASDWLGPGPRWPPPPSRACIDLPGHRLTLHQLGGTIETTVAATRTNCFFSKVWIVSASLMAVLSTCNWPSNDKSV